MLAFIAKDGDLNATLPAGRPATSSMTEAELTLDAALREWVESSPDAVACVDKEGLIGPANDQFRRIFGHEKGTTGAPLTSFVPLLNGPELERWLAESEDEQGVLKSHPLLLEGRIAGERRALLSINLQRISEGEPKSHPYSCVVALRALDENKTGATIGEQSCCNPTKQTQQNPTLDSLMQSALLSLHSTQRKFCELDIDEPEARLKIDHAPVRDALHMLISSANTRSPKNTRIRVVARTEVADNARWAVVTIADRGDGLKRRDLQRIFEPLNAKSTLKSACGTGLPLARRIIETQGGWIEIRSALGIGTEIDAWLPLQSV